MNDALFVGPGEGTSLGGGAVIKSGRVLALGEHSGGSWAVIEATLVAGFEGPPRHAHPFGEGWYVYAGTAMVTAGDARTSVPAGSYVYIPPGMPHTIANPGDEPVRLVTIGHAGLERLTLELAAAKDMDEAREIAARYDTTFM